MSANGQSLELAQCEQAHSSSTGPAVSFWVFRGDPAAMGGKIFINYRRDDSIGIAGWRAPPPSPRLSRWQRLFHLPPPPRPPAAPPPPQPPLPAGGRPSVRPSAPPPG